VPPVEVFIDGCHCGKLRDVVPEPHPLARSALRIQKLRASVASTVPRATVRTADDDAHEV
jgi:hypothetical protein